MKKLHIFFGGFLLMCAILVVVFPYISIASAPALVSATVNGGTVTLNYNQTLNNPQTVLSEGAESGLPSGATYDGHDTTYLLNSTFTSSGSKAFHFTNHYTNDYNTTSIAFPASFTVQSNSRLQFMSSLRSAGSGQTARAQIYTTDDSSWHDVYTQVGTGENVGTLYSQVAINLGTVSSGAYLGKPVSKVRFIYEPNSAGTIYIFTTDSFGWFVDDVSVINLQSLTNNTSGVSDTTAPTLTLVSPLSATTTATTTPNITFTTDEAGTITYGGSCSSPTTSATIGSNTIRLNTLTRLFSYANCTITVTDTALNASTPLVVPSIRITYRADATLNGSVNILDFGILASNYGTATCLQTLGDFNGSCTVNILDFGILVSEYGLTAVGQ